MISGPGSLLIGRNTLVKDWCWVCSVRFKTSRPPGPAHREDHHICPRNAGGSDGPLVSLCDSHHTCLHKIAERLHRGAKFVDLLIGEDTNKAKKLVWLAGMVVKSERASEDDPNKRLGSSVSLSRDEVQMLARLQRATGKTRNDLLRAGLSLLYKKYF